VFVSVLGNQQERDDTLAGLQHAHGLLQAEIARLTHMKRTPELKFVHDETVEQGMRVNELLNDEETGLRPPRSGSALEGEARPE